MDRRSVIYGDRRGLRASRDGGVTWHPVVPLAGRAQRSRLLRVLRPSVLAGFIAGLLAGLLARGAWR